MASKDKIDLNAPVLTADQIRMSLIQREMDAFDKRQKAKAAEEAKLASLANEFLSGQVSDEERVMIRRLVSNAINDGKFEAMVYSFPSQLCSDSGRAINNGDPNWPETLQGKAKVLYDRYQSVGKPAGYKLKAMIINFPGGMPGDVGFFLNWAPEST